MSKNKNKPAIQNTQKALSPTQIASITQTEHVGTAMMQSAQQMFLAVEQVLKEEFDFTQDDLSHFEKTITRMMESLAYLEERGLSVQTIDSMRQVSKASAHIAEIRKQRLDQTDTKIITPGNSDVKNLLS